MKFVLKDGKVSKKIEKVEVEEKTMLPTIGRLVSYITSLQFSHWRANTVTNDHNALGSLYEALQGLLDTFLEAYMGCYGVIDFPKGMTIDELKTPAKTGLSIVKELQSQCDEEDLQNILADMQQALHKAKYLLKE